MGKTERIYGKGRTPPRRLEKVRIHLGLGFRNILTLVHRIFPYRYCSSHLICDISHIFQSVKPRPAVPEQVPPNTPAKKQVLKGFITKIKR